VNRNRGGTFLRNKYSVLVMGGPGVEQLLDFDPFSAEVVADPYPSFEVLLRKGPVHWLESRQMFMAVGYEAVSEVIRDPTVFSSQLGYAAQAKGVMSQGAHVDMDNVTGIDLAELRLLIGTDPPDHTRVRRLVSRAFTPKAVAQIEPRLRNASAELVSGLLANAERGDADLMRDVAIPFPVTVIAELLGVSPDRRDDFRRWSEALAGALSGNIDMEQATIAGAELLTFLTEAVEERRDHSGDDLMSRLLAGSTQDDPDRLSIDEVVANSLLFLAAGSETTTNLIANAVAALAAHPDQTQELYGAPEMLPAMVEEVLRWDSPVQGLFRGTTKPITLAGIDLPERALVFVSFAAANRDPSHFEQADRFDITRNPRDHLAFGHGIHHCIGASLARLEARLVFEALLRTGITLEPTDSAVRATTVFLRGFQQMPVTCTPMRA
jgi:cytochrome P450